MGIPKRGPYTTRIDGKTRAAPGSTNCLHATVLKPAAVLRVGRSMNSKLAQASSIVMTMTTMPIKRSGSPKP